MKKAYIIPGFKHNADSTEYTWLIKYVKDLGYEPVPVKITWKNRVMSDYVDEFLSQYESNEEDMVIGFSFGAMIAMISSMSTQPAKLYLLSLSPYFSRDISHLRSDWLKMIGKNRASDFKKFNLEEISANLPDATWIFYGSEEGEKYPSLKKTCTDASVISGAELIVAKGAPHSIKYSSYQESIKQALADIN